MEKQLFADVPEEERSKYLRDNCDRVEPTTYMKTFESEEISGFKDELSELDIEMENIQEAKKEAMEEFKLQLEPVKARRKELLSNIRLQSVEVKEDTFMFVNEKERMVGFYNAKGVLVKSRQARPGEMQTTIFSVTRTGTDD
ncbi:hypothetical protein [Telluribacter humicola]|uniref:hypothetical protein n=1 Tax=Telluribacter humicola TaxID=1720261 RepID=UPI001A957D76|nr:hypothetical protein [Telluribacter humicola]